MDFDQGELFEQLEHMLCCPKQHVMIDVTRGHFRQIIDSREQADMQQESLFACSMFIVTRPFGLSAVPVMSLILE
jgi:hypothetical protein